MYWKVSKLFRLSTVVFAVGICIVGHCIVIEIYTIRSIHVKQRKLNCIGVQSVVVMPSKLWRFEWSDRGTTVNLIRSLTTNLRTEIKLLQNREVEISVIFPILLLKTSSKDWWKESLGIYPFASNPCVFIPGICNPCKFLSLHFLIPAFSSLQTPIPANCYPCVFIPSSSNPCKLLSLEK